MKRSFLTVLMVSSVLSFNALADVPSCGENCTYSLIQNNDDNDNPTYTLKIEPIDSNKDASVQDYERIYTAGQGYSTDAPYYSKTGITKIEIAEGIKSVGQSAFANMISVKELSLPEGLQTIAPIAFHGTSIETVNLPSTVKEIGNVAFAIWDLREVNGLSENLTELGSKVFGYAKIKDLVIPNNLTNISADIFGGESSTGWWAHDIENLYCPEALASQCAAALAYRGDDATVKTYQYEDGVYIMKDENGDDKYYMSADNMKRADQAETDEEKAQYICVDLDSCKANVLKNRGLCADLNGDCKDFVSSANAGRMLKVGSKTYQSLDALLKGDFDRRRIYTVEEANFVAGKKNSVMIRYK